MTKQLNWNKLSAQDQVRLLVRHGLGTADELARVPIGGKRTGLDCPACDRRGQAKVTRRKPSGRWQFWCYRCGEDQIAAELGVQVLPVADRSAVSAAGRELIDGLSRIDGLSHQNLAVGDPGPDVEGLTTLSSQGDALLIGDHFGARFGDRDALVALADNGGVWRNVAEADGLRWAWFPHEGADTLAVVHNLAEFQAAWHAGWSIVVTPGPTRGRNLAEKQKASDELGADIAKLAAGGGCAGVAVVGFDDSSLVEGIHLAKVPAGSVRTLVGTDLDEITELSRVAALEVETESNVPIPANADRIAGNGRLGFNTDFVGGLKNVTAADILDHKETYRQASLSETIARVAAEFAHVDEFGMLRVLNIDTGLFQVVAPVSQDIGKATATQLVNTIASLILSCARELTSRTGSKDFRTAEQKLKAVLGSKNPVPRETVDFVLHQVVARRSEADQQLAAEGWHPNSLIQVENGVLDVVRGELLPAHLLVWADPRTAWATTFDPAATAPNIQRFLLRYASHHHGRARYALDVMMMPFVIERGKTPDTIHTIFGDASAGKSALVHLFQQLHDESSGRESCVQQGTKLEQIARKGILEEGDAVPFDGSTHVTAADSEVGFISAKGAKALTSDSVTIRRLYRDSYSRTQTALVVMASNSQFSIEIEEATVKRTGPASFLAGGTTTTWVEATENECVLDPGDELTNGGFLNLLVAAAGRVAARKGPHKGSVQSTFEIHGLGGTWQHELDFRLARTQAIATDRLGKIAGVLNNAASELGKQGSVPWWVAAHISRRRYRFNAKGLRDELERRRGSLFVGQLTELMKAYPSLGWAEGEFINVDLEILDLIVTDPNKVDRAPHPFILGTPQIPNNQAQFIAIAKTGVDFAKAKWGESSTEYQVAVNIATRHLSGITKTTPTRLINIRFWQAVDEWRWLFPLDFADFALPGWNEVAGSIDCSSPDLIEAFLLS